MTGEYSCPVAFSVLAVLPLLLQEPTQTIEPVKTTVTVTGTRSPMEIDKSPVSTSLVTREELESRNIRQIDQALALIEGVNSLRTKGPGDGDFGLGLRGFAGRGGQSRTLILVDGQPVNNSYIGNVNWSAFAVSEMERVEVARGPFSSLYGGNAMGGVVNMITRPVDKRHFEVFGQLGNRDTTNYSIRATDRFFDKLGLSVGYTRFQTGGYSPQEVLRAAATGTTGTFVTGVTRWLTPTGGTTYQVGRRGDNWFAQEAWRFRGEYTFSPKVFASLQYIRQGRMEGWDAYTTSLRDTAGNPIDNGAVLFNDGGVTRRLTVTPANFIGTPTGALQNILQGQVLATLSTRWNMRVAAGVMRSPGDWYVTPGANATLRDGTGSYVNQTNQGVYGNIQTTWQGSGQALVFGTETRHDRARIAGQTVPNYAIRDNGAPYDTQARGKAINQAGYAQYQRTFGERMNIVAGGRYDYWRTYEGANQTGLTSPLVPYPNRETNSFTGKVAGTYTLPGNWLVRGSVGNAFRNPSVYELYRDLVLSGILFLANPQVQPEKLFAVEAGVQKQFARGHRFEASLFQNNVTDLIYRTTDFVADPTGNLRRLTNAGQGRTRGAEVALRQQVLSWLQFRQTYTYTQSVITRNDALPATIGRRLPYVPLHTVTYLATAARNKWSATWAGRYVTNVFTNDVNSDVVRAVPGSYNLFFEMDATVTYQATRRISFVANADNLLGRRYYMFSLTPGRSVFGGVRFRM
ncbi:TonB-dependent receptor [Bryobacterales bacterium F-183]|nr:TonB-dependent receptor [Bryobacterales bacterium F-183]